MELQAIGSDTQDHLPPPNKSSLRDWFAGLALGNAELMKDVPLEQRAAEAVRLADELVVALAAPRAPSLQSMAAPSEQEMCAWDAALEKQEKQKIPTAKEMRAVRSGMLPPPITVPVGPRVKRYVTPGYSFPDAHAIFLEAAKKISSNPPKKRVSSPNPGRYLIITDVTDENDD